MLQSFIMKITQKKTIISLLITLALTLTSCDFSDSSEQMIERSGLYFDTYVSITLYDTDNVNCADETLKICEKYDNLFSISKPDSDITKINNAGTESVTVDKDTCEMLSLAQKFSSECNGSFDVSIYPVSKLWDFHTKDGIVPSNTDIEKALEYIDFNNIIIDTDNNCVTKTDKNVQIDPGAVAKGYIADKIKEYLISCNIDKAVINMGGDLCILGSKTPNNGFKIAIKNPDSDESVLECLELNDISVATSGIYERCFTVNDTLYHHILDPKTGYPAATDIKSISIISDSSAYCDMVCTSCIVMGLNDSIKFIDNAPNIEAVILDTSNNIHYSKGIAKYMPKQ